MIWEAFTPRLRHACPYSIPTCSGCPPYDAGSSDEDDESTYRDCPTLVSDKSAFEGRHCTRSPDQLSSRTPSYSRSPTPAVFHSPGTYRSQLQEEFAHLYFPVGNEDTDFMYTKFLSRDTMQPASLSMKAAVDAICLIQLGTTHKDQHVLHEAVSRYNAAVANLRYDLARTDAVYGDGVIGAIYILGFCEIFRAVSSDGHVRRTHHRGLESMLLERGPKARYSPFAQLLLYNIRHIMMLYGLIDRKRPAFADPAWKRCTALTSGLMVELTDLVLCVPGLLEECDRCLQHPKKHAHKVLSLLVDLTRLEGNLQTWLIRWLASSNGLPYWSVNAFTFGHFTLHSSGVADAFPKAFQFPSFSSASAQTMYWIALLQVKQTILQVTRLSYAHPVRGREKMLVAEANECAANLCQSAAWLSQPKHGSCGIIRTSGPLHYAARWFAGQRDLGRLAWCRSVKQSIERDGIILPYKDYFGPVFNRPSSGSVSGGSLDLNS